MKSHTLVGRDRALAMALGVIALTPPGGGADFGADRSRQSPQRRAQGGRSTTSDFGIEFGNEWDYGVEFGEDAPAATPGAAVLANPAHPLSPLHPANRTDVVKMWSQQMQGQQRTQQRASLLEPNKGSSVKIQRYSFAVGSTNLTLGTSGALNSGNGLSNSPSTNFRPERFVCNAPTPGFVTLSGLQVANVNSFVGTQEDAWSFNANSVGIHLSLPTLTPSNKAFVSGNYTGFVPPGFSNAAIYPFIASFTGWATIVA